VSLLAVLTGLLGLVAEQQREQAVQQRIEAEEQRKQANEILAGATNIFATPLEGDTQTQIFEKSLELFRRGAGRGDDTSMYMLAQLYANGQGTAQDYGKARDWYEKAAVPR